jgi:hypothetical protein
LPLHTTLFVANTAQLTEPLSRQYVTCHSARPAAVMGGLLRWRLTSNAALSFELDEVGIGLSTTRRT